MYRPTSQLNPKFQSEDTRTVAVSAVAPLIPDSWRPVAHVQYMQSFWVHGALAPINIAPRKLSLATLASTKLTTMPTPRVRGRIVAWLNFLAYTTSISLLCGVSRPPNREMCHNVHKPQNWRFGRLGGRWPSSVVWQQRTLFINYPAPDSGLWVWRLWWPVGPATATWYWFGKLFSFHCPFQDRIFHSSHASQLIGKCRIYRLSKSLRRLGIPRTYTGLRRVRIQYMLSTVYQPLDRIFGPHRRHLRCQSSPLCLTRIASLLIRECHSRARDSSYGGGGWYKRKVYERVTLKCNAWESKSQMKYWPRDGQANSPSDKSAWSKNSGSSVSPTISCWSLMP
jgi:hypothetical protein